jgi:dynein heavy chain
MFISLQLVAVLREVKYLTIQGQQDVPPSAAEVFSQSETFRKYVGNLDLIVSWYNQVQDRTLEGRA